VTAREVAQLGLAATADARSIASALAALLELAVQRGCSPLSLAPLHVTGGAGFEGGGLLYHRPSNPAAGSVFDIDRPRRFDPHTLPALQQVSGHSGHAKCVHELGDWCTPRAKARAHGGIRTLSWLGASIVYDLGVVPRGGADVIMVDGELRRVPAEEVDLLPLDALL